MEANHIVLSDSPVFRDNFSPEILKRTVPLIKGTFNSKTFH